MTIDSALSVMLMLLLTAAISGAFLTIAVRIFNAIITANRKDNGIPVPGFGRAMVIGLVSSIACYLTASIMDWITLVPGPAELGRNIGAIVFGLISFAVISLVLSIMLKIRYPRAMGVSLCWILGMLLIFFLMNLIMFALALVAPVSE